MPSTLLRPEWGSLDPHELRILLDRHFGTPGQYDGVDDGRLYLPHAGSSSRVVLEFRDGQLADLHPGVAFDSKEWDGIAEVVEQSLLRWEPKTGRDYSFSSTPVSGSWFGQESRVQILPAPDSAPRAPFLHAEHPFVGVVA